MTMMSCSNNTTQNNHNQFGDTTLTKVFVGGLAWETPKEALREHFDKYGDILEAVIISDKLSGRSKGYGFVTFKEAESASKACEDAAPVINGRRANCNLASLGARRPRSSVPTPSTTPPPPPTTNQLSHHQHHMIHHHHQQGSVHVAAARATLAANQHHQVAQWYYPAAQPAYPHHHHNHAVPFYGYTPTYIAADLSYNQKLSYGGGAYLNAGQYGQVYGQHNTMPMVQPMMYPFYHFQHQSQAMGLPAAATHFYAPAATAAGAIPAIISKPGSMVAPPPMSVCLAVE
ncbi:Probable RNA-binding protein ARP1 [Linum grandiflorum]